MTQKFSAGMSVYLNECNERGIITAISTISNDNSANTQDFADVLIVATNVVLRNMPVRKISPACDVLFKVGDKVRSLLGGGFVGIVTGFEYAENRVVCLSNKECYQPGNSYDRCRYSYAVKEIEVIPNSFAFELNAKYMVNEQIKVRVIENPNPKEKYLLVREDNGTILVRLADVEIHWDNLNMFGIKNIQRMK